MKIWRWQIAGGVGYAKYFEKVSIYRELICFIDLSDPPTNSQKKCFAQPRSLAFHSYSWSCSCRCSNCWLWLYVEFWLLKFLDLKLNFSGRCSKCWLWWNFEFGLFKFLNFTFNFCRPVFQLLTRGVSEGQGNLSNIEVLIYSYLNKIWIKA